MKLYTAIVFNIAALHDNVTDQKDNKGIKNV